MSPPTGHRGNRGEPRWAALEWAVRENEPITLTPEACRDILLWANEVTEDKNIVVRDNHAPPHSGGGPPAAGR